MTTIGGRVRSAMQRSGMQQKQLAERIGMTPDALSRALNGQRGFAAVELADVATELGADVHELITGSPDPHRLVLSARHSFDHETGARSVDGFETDATVVADIHLAYEQAGVAPPGAVLPAEVDQVRRLLPQDFVRRFIDCLAEIDVDVVRIGRLSTAYSLRIDGRPVILLPEHGNWFYENWSLAHELGHLALGHDGVIVGARGVDAEEKAANAFAAELLMPTAVMRGIAWDRLDLPAVANIVWAWGVSTDALRRRLNTLSLEPSSAVGAALDGSTQKLLRRHWSGAVAGDPITRRMAEAGERRFPGWLQEAHLERIAEGAIGKGTLAWMLGVPEGSLELDEPRGAVELSDEAFAALLG